MPGAATPGNEKAFRKQTEAHKYVLHIHRLPFFCKTGGRMLLIKIRCKFCQCFFHVCRRCFRGQVYCCDFCRIEGKCRKHREAQRRYRETLKGRKNHREAENRRRQRRKDKGIGKKLDDATSTLQVKWAILMMFLIYRLVFARKSGFSGPRCRFCGIGGQVVSEFPRRPYGKINTKAKRRA